MQMMFLLSCVLSFVLGFERFVVCEWTPLMENPEMYEGDMILTPEQQIAVANGYSSVSNIWPKVIYYDWDPQFNNKNAAILNAILDYERYTCLRFHRQTNQEDYIYFFQGTGCSSGVGYAPGKQRVNIGRGCETKAIVIHELGHRIGIEHEQTRPNRDNYVTIKWENIKDGSSYNFNIKSEVTSHNTTYDYKSIMHYGAYVFSKNGQPTIITKDPTMQNVIGKARGLSKLDVIQINRMYKCDQGVPPPSPKGRRPAAGTPFVLRHFGGRCVSVNSNNELYLTSKDCNTKFTEIDGGYLEVFDYNKCVENIGGGTLGLTNFCDTKFKKVNMANDTFIIQLINNGRDYDSCIHPHQGWTYPEEGTKLVEYQGCTGNKLKFRSQVVPKPKSHGFVLRHSSGKCVSINSNNELYFTSKDCTTKFSDIDGGPLWIYGTQKCVQEKASPRFLEVKSSSCTTNFKKLDVQPNGSFSIELFGTDKCIHPYQGSSQPSDGTKLVSWVGCDEERLRFTAKLS